MRKRLLFLTLLLVAMVLPNAPTAWGDLIVDWNFNDSNLIADHGTGTLTTTFAPPPGTNPIYTTGTTLNAVLGDVAGNAVEVLGGSGSNGQSMLISVSLTGFLDPVLSFAAMINDAHGFDVDTVEWSINNTNFFTSGISGSTNPFAPSAAFAIFTFSGAAANALDNAAIAYFRVTFSGADSGNGHGAALDNLRIDATSIGGHQEVATPEPSSLALVSAFGLFGFTGWRARRQQARRQS